MKKVLIINLFTVIFLVLSLEFVVRIFGLAGLQGYDKGIFYSENGHTLSKPNSYSKVFGEYIKIDSNGFRIPINDYFYDDNKKSILILGDSVSFGVGMKEEKTFVGIIRKDQKKNILNASVSGHNLESYLYLIKKYNKKFDGKFQDVVIFLCLNDIMSFQGAITKDVKDKNYKEKKFIQKYIKNNIPLKINVFLREKSALFVLLKGLLTNPMKRQYNYISWMYDNEESLEVYKNFIYEINEYSKSNNLNTKFILLPFAYQIKNQCNSNLLKPQLQINKIFDELNLKLYDYSEQFCKSLKNIKLYLPYDTVHLSIHGHEYVSSLLKEDKIIN